MQKEQKNIKLNNNKKNSLEKEKQYLENLEKLKQRPYYDEEQDKIDQQNYYKVLNQQINYESLHNLIHSTYSHAKRRENLFPIIDRQPDYTLKCVYTGEILETSEGQRLEKCDEEHSVPQSYQQGTRKGCGKDMHQIFAASKHANGSRGNKPFGKLTDNILKQTESGTLYDGQRKTFVPKINKGAVARSTLYILNCYDEAMDPVKFPPQLVQWSIEHALNEEVTVWEKHRNSELFRLQGNRNPFIDHPEWAQLIDFSKGFQNKNSQENNEIQSD